jgi:hypothetical protein
MKKSAYLKLAFVTCLRTVFADPTVPPQYRYDPERKRRQLWIYVAWPKRTASFPCIIVQAGESDDSVKALGPEVRLQNYDENKKLVSQTFGGPVEIPINLIVRAKTPTDRDILRDLVSDFVRYVFRNTFAALKINYLDISSGGDEVDESGAEPIHEATITVRCQTETYLSISLSMYQALSKIDVSGLVYSVEDISEGGT